MFEESCFSVSAFSLTLHAGRPVPVSVVSGMPGQAGVMVTTGR